MEAHLLGAEPSAHALNQPADDEGDQQPASEAHEQGDQQSHVETYGSGRRVIHQPGISILVVAQLVWLALLAYGTYSIWQRLPF